MPTLEAEYIALSQGPREYVSAQIILLYLSKQMNLELNGVTTMSKALEDNIGLQNLANSKDLLMTS